MKIIHENLFDVSERGSMSAVRDMVVGPASKNDLDEFCRRWHYMNRGGSVRSIFGLWDENTLVGCVAYNLPTMETCASVFGKDRWHTVFHMSRLVCAENAPRNSESKLIGASLKLLKDARPDLKCVVTYAAQSAGHVGYVYQATNALYTGTGGEKYSYLDEQGDVRSTKQGNRVSLAGAEAKGWRRVSNLPKHRYIYLLGTKTEKAESRKLLLLEVQPYPKISAQPAPDAITN